MKKYFSLVLVLMTLLALPISSQKVDASEKTLDKVEVKIGFQGSTDLKTDMILQVLRTTSEGTTVVLDNYVVSEEELRDSKYTFTNDHFALTEGDYTVLVDFPDYNKDGSVNLVKHFVLTATAHQKFYIRNKNGELELDGGEIRFYSNPVFFDLNVSGQVSIDDSPVKDIAGIQFVAISSHNYLPMKELFDQHPEAAASYQPNYVRVSKETGTYSIQDMMFGENPHEPVYIIVTKLPEGMTEEDMGLDFKRVRAVYYNDLVNAPKGKRVIARQPIDNIYTQEVNLSVIDEESNEEVVSNLSLTGGKYFPVDFNEQVSSTTLKLFSGEYRFDTEVVGKEIVKVMMDDKQIDKTSFTLNNLTLSTTPKKIIIYVKDIDTNVEQPVEPVTPEEPQTPTDPETPKEPTTELPGTGLTNTSAYASYALVGIGTALVLIKKKISN